MRITLVNTEDTNVPYDVIYCSKDMDDLMGDAVGC